MVRIKINKGTFAFFASILVSLSFIITIGCSKSTTSITIGGSTAFQPFAEKLAESFMINNKQYKITVQGGGSSLGIQATQSGAVQIGMADLVVLPEEAKGLGSVVIARDGIAVIVHPQNPIKELRSEQVRGIFNGQIRNWKEVLGQDRPITVVSREAGSGTRLSFEAIIGQVRLYKDSIIQDSNGTIRETVANDANAIGYLTHGLLNEKIKAVSIDSLQSTMENLISGKYKLIRPVYFLYKEPASTAIRSFLDFVVGAEGQKILVDAGLISAK